MNDSFLTGRLECLRDLVRDLQRLFKRNRSSRDALGERFALDKLHYEEMLAVGLRSIQ